MRDRLVLLLVLGGAFAGCGRSMSDAELRARLVGQYDLSLGSAASVSASMATAGTLELDASGRFVQACRFSDGSTKRDEGQWSYHDARVHFSAFSDCSGVWPRVSEPMSAHLPVEIGDEPIILVSPETNTFYKQGPEAASCDPMVRVEPKVSVMFKNEWLSGSLVLSVCRGTPAEGTDLSPLMTWLAGEARAGRMRNCRLKEEKVSPEEMAIAAGHLPGLRDWCFLVVSDI